VTYMHAAVFLLAAGYTLKRDGHVRVDILYRRFSVRRRAWIDSLGCLIFLLPVAIFTGFLSREFVASYWPLREGATDAGGPSAVYLLKSLIPLIASPRCLQACAELLRNLLLLVGVTSGAGEAEQ